MVFKYMWLHIRTGKIGESENVFLNRVDFLEHLSKWNKDLRWKYWEV